MLCFADEPTSALDWGHGKTIIELLQERTRRLGATVLVVSHDRRLIHYADQVIHLDDGQLTGPLPSMPTTSPPRSAPPDLRPWVPGPS